VVEVLDEKFFITGDRIYSIEAYLNVIVFARKALVIFKPYLMSFLC